MDEAQTGVKKSWWRGILAGLKKGGMRPRQRRLRVAEMVGLGERRFVAVIEYEQQRFLIGGSATQVQMLTRLGGGAGPEPSTAEETVAGASEISSLAVH